MEQRRKTMRIEPESNRIGALAWIEYVVTHEIKPEDLEGAALLMLDNRVREWWSKLTDDQKIEIYGKKADLIRGVEFLNKKPN